MKDKAFPTKITAKDKSISLNVDLRRFNNQYDRAQMWLDNQVIQDSTPYVPMNTGALFKSAITGTELGSGEVVWDTPYARRCYYGENFNFRKDKHPHAQAYWFEAAKAANKATWIRTAKRKAGGSA